MTGLVAYLALTVALPALLLGHQGQHWPLRGACAWLYGRLSASGGLEVDGEGSGPREASSAHTAPRIPSWAHTQPLDYEEAA